MDGNRREEAPPVGQDVIVRFDDPRFAEDGVIGSVKIAGVDPAISTTALVRNGTDIHLDLPASDGYFARGLLASGEYVLGYARTERPKQPIYLELALDDGVTPSAPDPGFQGRSWAAGWVGNARGYMPVNGTALAARGQGLEVNNDYATLVQVSQSGRPPCCIARIPGETLTVDKEHATPDGHLATTLLTFLQYGDRELTEPVAREALRVAAQTGGSRGPTILDLAIAYHLLYTGADPDAAHAARLAENARPSADISVILAWTHLRARPPRFDAAAKLLEESMYCGLPAVTQGLQLLVDGLHTMPDGESAAIAMITPFAASARIGEIMTTFWGTDPNHPRPSPIVAQAPPHAATVSASSALAAARIHGPGPISRAAAEARPIQAAGLSAALERVSAELVPAVGLASQLALAAGPDTARALAGALGDALRRAEAASSISSSQLSRAVSGGTVAVANRRLTAAIRQARVRLRDGEQNLARAQTQHAQAWAMRGLTAKAAELATDTCDAVSEMAAAEHRQTGQRTVAAVDRPRAPQALQAPQGLAVGGVVATSPRQQPPSRHA